MDRRAVPSRRHQSLFNLARGRGNGSVWTILAEDVDEGDGYLVGVNMRVARATAFLCGAVVYFDRLSLDWLWRDRGNCREGDTGKGGASAWRRAYPGG